MPLPAEIGCIDHPLAVRREVRSRAPVRFFIMNLACLGARFRFYPPEAAGPMNVSAIGNDQYLRAISRPYRTDLMIHFAVVITRQVALMLGSQLLDIAELSVFKPADKNVKVAFKGGRHECESLSIR